MKTLLAVSLALLASAAQASGWDKLSGQDSAIKEPLKIVVKTQADWEALWKRHSGGELKSLPAADFRREMIVAVFIGERKTAGTKVELEVLPDPMDKTKLVVFYRETPPSDDGFAADVVSRPYAILKVARGYKSVDFALNTRCRALLEGLNGPSFN
jgi:hypothetical protein